ncbi:MAG: class I SAM-dependent methyltransferase [Melioribacteraceae bacterium]|nr:class I SAM-dependent methyltransferase [Melioribacteraceae bacterium]
MKEYDYKEDARNYDEQVKEYNSYAHEALFGMSYEFVSPSNKLLDLGIGTGLASINFSKAGLKIYGLDISEEMLNICRTKSFTEELKLHNISEKSLPYNDDYFNHIICSGVFHFLGDLGNIFSEVTRIIKKGGIFAFSIAPDPSGAEYTKQMTSWKVPIYKHSPDYIMKLLKKNRMSLLKEMRLLMKGADKLNYDILFSIMITKSL